MKSRLLAVLSLISLAACGGIDQRLTRAAEAQGQLEAATDLPDLPEYCRQDTRSGVRVGDRLDTALLKTDAALAEEHRRNAICADWYDELKAGLALKEKTPGGRSKRPPD